ncbi:MAG: hypothetical protein ACKO0Z_17440 [Betaproteobacteria bacterium]
MTTTQLSRFASGYGGPLTPSGSAALKIDGSGIAVAWIVQTQTTNAITAIRARYGLRFGTPPLQVVTIETVNSSGRPSGTDAGGASPTAKIITPPASTAWDTAVQTITLTNAYTPATKGEWIAITIRYSSGTVDASNASSWTYRWSGLRDTPHLNLGYTLSGGTWTASPAPGAIGWTTASENLGCVPKFGTNSATTAATNGHRSGGYFTLPTVFGSQVTVRGVQTSGIMGATGTTCTIVIVDTGGSVLATQTIDTDLSNSPSSERQLLCYFDSPPVLSTGVKYYCAIEVAGSSAVTMSNWTFETAADMSVMPLGSNIGQAMWNGSVWTETATRYPLFELILDDMVNTSSGGGAIIIGS